MLNMNVFRELAETLFGKRKAKHVPAELALGLAKEMTCTSDERVAHALVEANLQADPHYYSKAAGLVEKDGGAAAGVFGTPGTAGILAPEQGVFRKPRRKDWFGEGGGQQTTPDGIYPPAESRGSFLRPSRRARKEVGLNISVGTEISMVPTTPFRKPKKAIGAGGGQGGGSGDGDSSPTPAFASHTFVVGPLKNGEYVRDRKRVNPYEALFQSEWGMPAYGEPKKKPPYKFPETGADMGFNDSYDDKAKSYLFPQEALLKYNENHDKETGQFSSGGVSVLGMREPSFDPEKGPLEVKHSLGKQATGRLVESIVQDYLGEGATALNQPTSNFPIDMRHGNDLIEIKGGVVSNERNNQHWRFTYSLTQDQQAMINRLPTKQVHAYREALQHACMARKNAMYGMLQKQEGVKFNKVTMTAIVHPDTKTADIYRFKGWHEWLPWKGEETKNAFVASVRYG